MSAWLSILGVSVRSVCARRAVGALRAGPSPRRVLVPQSLALRGFSSTPIQAIKYEEVKQLLKDGNTVLIDVREPWEVKEYGVIQGSLNIPLGDVVQALQMNPKKFEEKYQKRMPVKSDTLIFSCLAGIRSKKALDAAVLLGYTSVQHYAGGFDDWTKHELTEKKP
ncbi:thiosulfate sulfurtransferase/rhodanese-like domain-containing protein 3 [Discoglossus pictus]